MLSIEKQEQISQKFFDSYRKIETEYLELIAKQLNSIGTLNPSNVKRLEQIIIMNGNIDTINKKLSALTKHSIAELETLLTDIATEQYGDANKFYKHSGIVQVSFAQNKQVQKIIKSIANVTSKSMVNITNSTVTSLSYLKAVDGAILAVTSGVGDYNTSIRKIIRSAASQGIGFVDDKGTRRINYKSGYKRRLDSAVRMNVMDGMHQVNMGVAKQTGEEFGADGVEITSHSNPAPDHKNIDGETYSNKAFEKLQDKLDRPIGWYNCYHFAIPVILDISSPTFTKSELKAKQKKESKLHPFGGQNKTKYEWSQEQRKLETQIRYQEDVLRMSKITGDADLTAETKNKIKILKRKYEKMSNAVGLDMEKERF